MNKKQENARKLVDKTKQYSLDEALDILPSISTSNFSGSIELNINLNLNDKQKKETLRGSVTFPHSFGKEAKVLVLAEKSDQDRAKKAGADFAGLDDMIKKIEDGWMDFDVVIATPSVMSKIASLGKYIGKQGLMPNPKNQTVTTDLEKVVKMYKQGKKDFKKNDQDTINIIFGKIDMKKPDLKENFETLKSALKQELNKIGNNVIKNIYISPTMGPSIKLALSEFE